MSYKLTNKERGKRWDQKERARRVCGYAMRGWGGQYPRFEAVFRRQPNSYGEYTTEVYACLSYRVHLHFPTFQLYNNSTCYSTRSNKQNSSPNKQEIQLFPSFVSKIHDRKVLVSNSTFSSKVEWCMRKNTGKVFVSKKQQSKNKEATKIHIERRAENGFKDDTEKLIRHQWLFSTFLVGAFQ